MLFKLLKLFRLDVSAMMDSVKAGLDLRFEQAKDGFSQMAVQVVVIAALLVFAAIAGAMLLGVALIALYQWTAEEAGVYAGLGAVGAALIVVATVLAIAAAIRSRSFPRIEKLPDVTPTKTVTLDTGGGPPPAMGMQTSPVRLHIPRPLQQWRPQMHPPAISWRLWPSSWRRL